MYNEWMNDQLLDLGTEHNNNVSTCDLSSMLTECPALLRCGGVWGGVCVAFYLTKSNNIIAMYTANNRRGQYQCFPWVFPVRHIGQEIDFLPRHFLINISVRFHSEQIYCCVSLPCLLHGVVSINISITCIHSFIHS